MSQQSRRFDGLVQLCVEMLIAGWCVTAQAQVPQKLNYQGFLTTATSTPINGAVVLTFRLYDAATNGALKYTETQLSVNVVNGVFDTVIGSVTPLPVPFDAPYWLTVAVNADGEMMPRQQVTASAYALRSANADALAPAASVAGAQITGTISAATLPTGNLTGTIPTSSLSGTIGTAQIANNAITQGKLSATGAATAGKVLGTDGSNNLVWLAAAALPPCFDASNRYKDCGDGTVYDKTTGLMWEQKLASANAACTDPVQANRNVRCQQNFYTWSAASPFTEPTGTLYDDFLEKLNDLKTPNDGTATPCFAGYCDWRIPTIGELRSILLAPYPNCPSSPCVDPVFGPTQANLYWSSSSLASSPGFAWHLYFFSGHVNYDGKGFSTYARAVRGGR